ncbi:hypothetical protein K474DRAFT_1649903 [Panus rudis PR-1116 ss-1]|nr:hypothetical protein K474DRAFT_1649903 [Panus rudis PR-1116 ss-1]
MRSYLSLRKQHLDRGNVTADAKFPYNKTTGLPPSPSRENPGQVFPKSDPHSAPADSVPGTGGGGQPASLIGNPFALNSVLEKLDSNLDEAISAIEGEQRSASSSADEHSILQKFKRWKAELAAIRAGKGGATKAAQTSTPAQEGGLFTD